MEPTATGETAQPATLPIGSAPDLATWRDGKAKGLTDIPNPAVTKPAAPAPQESDDAPDPEVEADPELRKAIDEIEAPKDNESPAEKAARTKRNKEAARKGYTTRQKNRADRAEARARELEEELRRRPTAPSGRQDDPVAAPRSALRTENDPADPEPTLESVTAKYPNDPDPYGRLQRELAAYDRRQEARAVQAERAQETQRQQAHRIQDQVGKHADAGRGVHPDYDVKVGALGALLHGHPADVVIAEALAEISDTKVGSEVLYRAAAHLPETQAAIAAGRNALLRYLGRLEAAISADAVTAAPAPIISAAPAPHAPVAAAPSKASGFDMKSDTGSVADFRRHKASMAGAGR